MTAQQSLALEKSTGRLTLESQKAPFIEKEQTTLRPFITGREYVCQDSPPGSAGRSPQRSQAPWAEAGI